MKIALRLTGNALMASSVVSALALAVLVLAPEQVSAPTVALSGAAQTLLVGGLRQSTGAGSTGLPVNALDGASPRVLGAVAAAATTPSVARRPITHIDIASIELATDVVPAQLVELDGGVTWEVPAFKVGHAESTAGAGQSGNAVLLGHVTSIHSGNVFRNLGSVKVGDTVHVVADSSAFDYTVVSTRRIARGDSSVLEQGATAALSLITCTGMWLPTIWDYTERLVVRAELASSQ